MGLSGDLGYFKLPELLQVLGMGGNSGTLTINGDAASGTMVFAGGRLVDARLETKGRRAVHEGEEAFFALLANTSGAFVFDAAPKPRDTEPQADSERSGSVDRGLDALLLEAHLRLQKE
jgi:hypothetical protein